MEGLECNPGTFPTREGCSPCPQGTFSADYLKTSERATCSPCAMGDTTAGPGSKSRHACVPNPEFVRPESEQKTRRPFPATVVAAVMSPGLVIVLLLAYRNHLANKRIKQLENIHLIKFGHGTLNRIEDGVELDNINSAGASRSDQDYASFQATTAGGRRAIGQPTAAAHEPGPAPDDELHVLKPAPPAGSTTLEV